MLLAFVLLFLFPTQLSAHGFLCSPPARNALWACYDPSIEPKNYDLMALNAGGRVVTTPGFPSPGPLKYGICGDPADGPQEHQVGGKFYQPVIPATYCRGASFLAQVNITAYHRGYFLMQLCPTFPETESCFSTIANFSIEATSTREGSQPHYDVPVTLPSNVSCEHCVLRWFYITNNSPGLPPEIFINCADIRIH